MLFESELNFFTKLLKTGLQEPLEVKKFQHVAGGDINHASKVTTNIGEFFVKWNQFPEQDMFEKEAKGLNLLYRADTIDVTKPLAYGQIEGRNYLILEFIDKGRQGTYFWEDFGEKLALLHQKSSPKFGLDYNNYIGKLLQQNHQMPNWVEFFIEQRIKPQLALGRNKGIISHSLVQRFEPLFEKLPDIIPDEPPALLHGDLWSGNFMCGPNHLAWLIDPAVYYGHREMEIAFTQLFGGFDQQFYQSYNTTYPLDPGFDERVDIHNIYPLLVHVNLFGTSYLSGVERALRRFS